MDRFPFTDKELQEAAASVRSAMLDSLPRTEDCAHTFSPEFEEKIERLKRRQKSREFHRLALRRVAAVFLALLIGAGAWLTVDTDARAAFFRWVRETYEDMTVYWFRGEPTLDALPTYRPSAVPEGWQEVSAIGDDTIQNIVYISNENSNEGMVFTYSIMKETRPAQIIYTGTVTEVEVNGCPGEFYNDEISGDPNGLVWFDEENGIAFSISAPLPLPDIMHIAESVSLCDSTN